MSDILEKAQKLKQKFKVMREAARQKFAYNELSFEDYAFKLRTFDYNYRAQMDRILGSGL